MKVIRIIVGLLLVLTGIVWFLQGINVLPGSFMTGQIEYAILGIAVAITGIGLVVYPGRRKSAAPDDEAEQGKNQEGAAE